MGSGKGRWSGSQAGDEDFTKQTFSRFLECNVTANQDSFTKNYFSQISKPGDRGITGGWQPALAKREANLH